MDLHRFDTLTRALASGHSRRGALALLSSLLAVPVRAGTSTEARKKKK